MKRLAVAVLSAMGMLLSAGSAAPAQTSQTHPVLHRASASQIITVAVKRLRQSHGNDEAFVIAQAAGFAPELAMPGVQLSSGAGLACDVITTFDVVKMYEERQTWKGVRQRIDIVVNGTAYPARFREVGFYPLGLNLACIDFESPNDRAAAQLTPLRLDQNSADGSAGSYNNTEIANSDPGTPFLNSQGEISSVLIAAPGGPLEFASADDIRRFLDAASAVSARPVLSHRTLASILL